MLIKIPIEFVGEQLERLDVSLPEVRIGGVLYRRVISSYGEYMTAAGPVKVRRQRYRAAGSNGHSEAGFVLKLANTVAIRKYDGLKHSGDEADARQLAHLLRLGILPTGTILAPDQRASRDLGRKRLQLVRSRTQHILAIENIVARQTGAKIISNQVKRLTADAVQAMRLPRVGRKSAAPSAEWAVCTCGGLRPYGSSALRSLLCRF